MKTIKLKKYVDIILEKVAAEAITPGMLIAVNSDDKFAKVSGEGAVLMPMFALEDELQGNGITDDYAEGDPVQAWIPQRGEEVLAILEDGETAVIGSQLISAGNGNVKVYDGSSAHEIIAIATEAVDMSGSSGEDPDGRIAIRLI